MTTPMLNSTKSVNESTLWSPGIGFCPAPYPNPTLWEIPLWAGLGGKEAGRSLLSCFRAKWQRERAGDRSME